MGVATCCDFSVATIGDMLTLVHDADVVISLHGAGLINAIFSKPKVRLSVGHQLCHQFWYHRHGTWPSSSTPLYDTGPKPFVLKTYQRLVLTSCSLPPTTNHPLQVLVVELHASYGADDVIFRYQRRHSA